MGGNVFQGTSDFDHQSIDQILKTVNQALAGTGVEAIPVGSAATPTPGKRSGDPRKFKRSMDKIIESKHKRDSNDS